MTLQISGDKSTYLRVSISAANSIGIEQIPPLSCLLQQLGTALSCATVAVSGFFLPYFLLLCNHWCQNGTFVFLARVLSKLFMLCLPLLWTPAFVPEPLPLFAVPQPPSPGLSAHSPQPTSFLVSHQGCIFDSFLYIGLLSPLRLSQLWQ